jgi:hypothetical protein
MRQFFPTNDESMKYLVVIFLIFILTLSQFRMIYRLNGGRDKIENIGYNEYNLITGETDIRAWVNRALAPLIVLGLTHTTSLPWHSVYLLLSVLMLFLTNIVLYYYFHKFIQNYKTALVFFITYTLAFLLLQHYYIFLWDYIDTLLFSAFVFGILSRFSLLYFIILFIVSMFNRESSLFIALYLFIQSFQYIPKIKLISKKYLFISISLILINVIYIKSMRQLFYNGPEREQVYTGIPALIGNENHLTYNLKYFFTNFYYFFVKLGPDFNITISIFILFLIVLTISCLIHGDKPLKQTAFILAVIIVSVFVSGLIMETRMWLITLPFIFLVYAYLRMPEHNHLKKIFLFNFAAGTRKK